MCSLPVECVLFLLRVYAYVYVVLEYKNEFPVSLSRVERGERASGAAALGRLERRVHDQVGFVGVYSIQLDQRYTSRGDPRPPSWGALYDLPNENAPSQLSTWFPPS